MEGDEVQSPSLPFCFTSVEAGIAGSADPPRRRRWQHHACFSLHPPIYQRLQISHLPLSRESTHPPFKLTHPPHASTRRTSTTRRRCRERRRERQSAGSAGRDAGRKRMKAWVCPPACSSRRLSDTENTFQTEGESGGGGAASRSSYSSQRPITALACAGDVINSLA